MEKAIPTTLSEQQKEHKDDGENTAPMSLVSKKEDFAALECPQGEERITAFIKDAKTSLENVALVGASKEGEIVLKKTVPGSSEKLEAASREGKVTGEMCNRKEEPSFLTPFTHQQPDAALEACKVTDEPNPSPCAVVSNTTRKKEACTKAEDRLKSRKGCYRAKSRGSADQRSTTALWDCSTRETMGSVSKEESTLERLPGLKDLASSKEAARKNNYYPKEPTSAMEPNIIKTVQRNTDDLEGELQPLDPGKASVEISPPPPGAQTVSGDERHHSNEPKQLEAFSKEHLDKRQGLGKKGFRRLDWLSEHNEGLRPPYRNVNKPTDVATNLAVRGQSAREASLLALPVFRKMQNPHASKARTVESALSPRKGQAMDSDLAEVSSANTAEWALQMSGHQTATDLSVRKHAWTANAGDVSERVPLRSVESPSCSTYDDTRPYMCNALVEEQGKDGAVQEEDPAVYTCIECSIYFKMKEHLMDHMLQHNRGLGLDESREGIGVANFDPSTFSLMRCEFCGAGFDTRAGLSSHARAHLRDFGITNWELTISPINILKELLANSSEYPMLQSALGTDPSSPNQEREMLGFGPCKSTTPISECSISQSPFSPFPPSWGDEPMQPFRDVMASEEEEEMVTAEMGSPALQKKSSLAGSLDHIPNRIGSSLSPETSSNKADSQDSKTPNLTTCEVCGVCFETRKGLSSHARSHLRQLGVAESESSGAPIDLLYELMKQKGKVDSGPISPSLSKKSGSPKEGTAGSSQPTLLPPNKATERPQEAPINKAIKCPPGFTPKNVAQPGSPILKKVTPALPGSPLPKTPEDKSPKLPLSPLQSSPKAQWSQPEEEGPLNLTVDSDSGREIDCQLCGAWFETRKGLSSHARAHLRHLGVSDPDAKGSPIDVLNDLIKSEDFKGRPPSLLHSERETLGETGSSDGPSPKSTATAAPATGMKQAHAPRPLGKQPSVLSPHSPPPSKKLKPHGHRLSAAASLQRKQGLSSSAYWAPDAEMAPLNLSSGAEPVRDIRCEFCGEYFENRKGLSSHARSHLRQMGVTEWYVNGSPIDTLREILKRRAQPRTSTSNSPAQGQKSLALSVLGGSLESRGPGESHVPPMPKKAQQPGSPLGHSPTSSPPTARKIFPGLSSPSLHKKLKQDQLRMEIKREMMSGGLHNDSHLSDRAWSPREEMSPLNLSSRADPVRDIRCEFCGEFFENRKGLSSHARSHLRQMGVTEWSVNGSPIDTLREIIKKKNKPCLIKKEPNTMSIELPQPMGEDGADPKSPGKMLQPMALSPLGGRTGKPHLGREVSLSPLKSPEGFLAPLSTKRPLPDERLSGHSEVKQKTYIQTELPFKAKHVHDKPTHTSTEACCELCGLYFENRKALASHARAHLRQFGVTEWCVNGSPIETLSEWIKHRPQKAGAYRSYIQGGRPFTKKFRNASHVRDNDASGKRAPLSLQAGSPPLANRSLGGEIVPSEPSKAVDGGSGSGGNGGDRPAVTSPLSLVKMEEHQQHNINKFERRQAKPVEAPPPREEEMADLQQKVEEVRQPPPRVRPVPSLVPRPPQTSLVKFVGNIYTLKCRFCEVEFQGPLSIQEEWVRHLQRHILETNFSKADALRSGTDVPAAPPVAEAQ
ncbi:protein Wiz isoform X8 [Podarcis raffonei]|uniref:protein Wiz isoform X8 n=1 Tax=Podarcis raffonei TaxID=65483 RepID=UPI00232923AD|nr:protein Wiz isoform X8 [Podarcis raffonei]